MARVGTATIVLRLVQGGWWETQPPGEPELVERLFPVSVRGSGQLAYPQTSEIESGGPDRIAPWVDTDCNEESFFVRQAYFLGQTI
jgi:hypothetical protein